jgi:hypothetical protein
VAFLGGEIGMDRRVSWLLNLIFSCLVAAGGFLILLLPFSYSLREWMYDAPLENRMMFVLIGTLLFLLAGFLLVILLQGEGRRAYRIEGNLGHIYLHEGVVTGYIERYWKAEFPEREIVSQVRIRGDRIEIRADLPRVAEDEQQQIIKKVERDLAELFKETLGYKKEYLLAISFPSETDGRISRTAF